MNISFHFLEIMMKVLVTVAFLVALLSMEILAASLNVSPKAQQETPEAEERTFGLLALFALWPAIKGFFSKIFLPVTY